MTRDEARKILREEYYRLCPASDAHHLLQTGWGTIHVRTCSVGDGKHDNAFGVGADSDPTVAMAKAWLDLKEKTELMV